MTPYHHAVSSVKKFGGTPKDYIAIHNWFDETKQYTGDWTHRALRHHSAGIEWSIKEFGHFINITDIESNKQKEIPVKLIAEQHVIEDCGFIPTVQDYLSPLKSHPKDWMLKVKTKHTEPLKLQEDDTNNTNLFTL